MNRIIHYTIEHDCTSLASYLKERGYSAYILTRLRQNDTLTLINNVPSYLISPLHKGDMVSIGILEENTKDKLIPADIPLDILYEDEDIIAINKPSHMPVHPSLGHYDNTLANALMHYYRNQDSPFVFRAINRLDRDTSGIVLVAKNLLSASILGEEMKNNRISKTYLAIVCGTPFPPEGTIDKPIGRVSDSCIARCVDETNGAHAITKYRTLKTIGDKSLVELKLLTGRTHQIRVHMAYIGNPLIGDFLYNPDNKDMNRQALHSVATKMTHPITGKPMLIEAPMPSDMLAICENYRE